MQLTFNALRAANIHRLPTFKNSKGELTHDATGSNWTPAQWLQALTGELGEYANLRKKFERGDISEAEFNDLAADELADIQIYLDLLAYRLNIDLADATRYKFNVKSREVGSTIFITERGDVINETRPQTMSGEVLYAAGIGEKSGYLEDVERLAQNRADRNYKLRCDIMELEKKIASKNAEIEKLQNDRAERNNRIDELGKMLIKHLSLTDVDQYNQTFEENKRLKEQVKSLENQNTAILKDRINDQLVMKGLNEQVSVLTRAKEAYKANYDQLANEHTSVRNSNYRLSIELETSREVIKSLEKALTSRSNESEALKDKLKAISKITDQEEQQIEIKIDVADAFRKYVTRTRRADSGFDIFGI